jgi:hypothetical protein
MLPALTYPSEKHGMIPFCQSSERGVTAHGTHWRRVNGTGNGRRAE